MSIATPLGDTEAAVNAAISVGFGEIVKDLPSGTRSLESALEPREQPASQPRCHGH